MEKTIDCLTLQGPASILKIRTYLEQVAATDLTILVDNDSAVDDVTVFLSSYEFAICVDTTGNSSKITGHRSSKSAQKFQAKRNHKIQNDMNTSPKTLIIISSDRFGKSDDKLGQTLMINYIKNLMEWNDELWRLILVNHGVRLSLETSSLLKELKFLVSSGIDLQVCKTSLMHLGLMDKKSVGQPIEMQDIVISMQMADKVINL